MDDNVIEGKFSLKQQVKNQQAADEALDETQMYEEHLEPSYDALPARLSLKDRVTAAIKHEFALSRIVPPILMAIAGSAGIAGIISTPELVGGGQMEMIATYALLGVVLFQVTKLSYRNVFFACMIFAGALCIMNNVIPVAKPAGDVLFYCQLGLMATGLGFVLRGFDLGR